MTRPIIIDTDPGIDDAVAILLALAAPELEIRGLVAVAGNVALATTEHNARAILQLAGRSEIPVRAGCPRPLGRRRVEAERHHGSAGLGDLVLSAPDAPRHPQHGVMWLVETLGRAAPGGVTLCALGPLTNVAAALVLAPEIAAGIGELVLMGGGTRGNVTPAAEFNIHSDPHAAAVVFDSGVPITMVPLDATREVRATPDRVAPLLALGTRCGRAAATLIGPRAALGHPPMSMHDACVIFHLLAPELCRARKAHVAVETQSALTCGMTVIDYATDSGRAPNASVVEAIDVEGFFACLAERIARLP